MDAIVQPLHLSSCFEHACTSPVIIARLEVCVGLEFGPDAIPAARHWRPMTEMQQERAIDGSPVLCLDAPCGGPERLLGGFHAFNRTTQGLPDNMLEYRCRHGTRAVVRPAPEKCLGAGRHGESQSRECHMPVHIPLHREPRV